MIDDSLLQHLTELSLPMIEDQTLVQRARDGFTPKRALTLSEEYVRNSLLALSEVETLMKQLGQATLYLSSYRAIPAFKKSQITRYDHIVYHMEMHLFKTTSVLDRLLILTNIILIIGAEQKKCKTAFFLFPKSGKLEYRRKIESYPGLYRALVKVEVCIEPYREDRNMVAHHKNIDYGELRPVEMYSALLRSDRGDDPDFSSKFKVVAKTQTDRVVADFKKSLEMFNQDLRLILEEVYKILREIFDEKYKALQNEEKRI
ncbi:Cthe_2314 family HEPN domain-containing protein [Pedobacter jeongneungensis]|uniref:Cthe_2314 family HEPN domain-containing protein n=1 Tax=Pedobacter jeongneungensis TaxID=947309 RepID=UPI00046AAE89|nr:Cthe_2314 family HEPN domain-containing protein [Pedobacter jeongneungensis]